MATSLPQEDTNFLRLAGLLQRIAPCAVRRWFDKEFHPDRLKQFLSKNRLKIYDMTFKEKVISQAMYNLLYPRSSSGVSSDKFDVSLMVCLLRNFTDLDIQDNLPSKTIHTTAADISRIKFYRNFIVHSDSRKVTEDTFLEIWNCVEEAICRLLPESKHAIDSLMSSSLTNVSDLKDVLRLEKELQKTNQHLNAINQKLEMLEIKNDNIREIRRRILKEWRENDKKYVSTSASTFIFKSLKNNMGIIITGSPGCGKSAVAHNVALTLENEGYEIFPCDDPSEILNHFTPGKFQVFVLDDVCGKFTLSQQKVDSWEQYNDKLNMLTESCTPNDENNENSDKSKVKFIITCRENIYSHKTFPKLTSFSLVQCSFSTKYKISPDEMRCIALSYVSEDTVNDIHNICLYDFFPLLCALYYKKAKQDPRFFTDPVEIIEKEISEMKIKCESSFLCLSLLVLRNNNISKDDIRSGDVEHMMKDICSDCKIEAVISMVSIQKSFEWFKDIYIIESEEKYTAIHDKMFDIIAAAIAPSIMKCLIKYGDIVFLANRIQLLSLGRSSIPFAVYIPQEFKRIYLKRIYKEAMNGKYWEVFGGIQAENETYRNLLLSFLKEQDTCQHISYVTSDDGPTPLFVSSSLGYVDFVEYFIAKCPYHINVKDKDGRSSFYVACKNGHIAVVKYLMKYYKDINAEMAHGTTALSATSSTEVAQLLLDNNADINRTNKSKCNALYYACFDGNVQMVRLLLSAYNLDTTLKDTYEQTTLHTACQKGHTQTFKYTREFCRDVNQQSDLGWTPLFIACVEGHYETVKLLLDLNGQTLNSCVDTTIKDNKGNSILIAACEKGHTEVVKLLIDIGMKLNDTSIVGYTPLFVACLSGHYDIVKLLLALNGQKINSRVDTKIKDGNGWSALHASCSRGHTEVVKLLIDVGLNVNEQTNKSDTPLSLACYNGHYETVKYLLGANGKTLDNRVDKTIKIQKGWSVLDAACSSGHTEIVKLLIDVGCDLNDINKERVTPLYLACTNGHYDTVKFLIALNGKLLESREKTTIKYKYGWSSLQGACLNGHTEIVKLLVDFGMNLNVTLNAGRTPLYLACQNGHYETVKFLLDLNDKKSNNLVDTTVKDENGQSVLHVACLNRHTEVVKLLIDVGLNVNDTTHNSCTPLHLACQNGHYDIVKHLLDLNGDTLNSYVDTTIKSASGWSVLHKACFHGHTNIVRLLITANVKINDKSKYGSTPLHLACLKGHYETVTFLLELNGDKPKSRVDTTVMDENGRSVLHIACLNGHREVVKLLIDVGLNVNDRLKNGSTPLFLACVNGHYETVKFLLDLNGDKPNSRVNTTFKDTQGNSVFHAAFSNKHTDVMKLLIDYGINEAEQMAQWRSITEYCVIS